MSYSESSHSPDSLHESADFTQVRMQYPESRMSPRSNRQRLERVENFDLGFT